MKPYYYAAENIGLRKWETFEEAQAEAQRDAAKHPGRAFEILRCVGIAQCSQASTFWMDGEGPPEKPRYRILDVGEICQEGDEVQNGPNGEWTPRQYRGKQLERMNPTRRPL